MTKAVRLPSVDGGGRRAAAVGGGLRCSAARTAASSSYPVEGSSPNAAKPQQQYKVRVLRYPDGYERVLRYPIDYKKGARGAAQASSSASTTTATALTETDEPQGWDIAGVWTKTDQQGRKKKKKESRHQHHEQQEQRGASQGRHEREVEEQAREPAAPSSIPDTPTELLRKQRSEEFLLSSKLEWDFAKSSYEILDACPWLEPRPLWILGTVSDNGVQSFTLRTRVGKEDTAAELEKLGLGAKRLEVSHLTDGLVAFESKATAEAFAEENATASTNLLVFEVGSHDLFQMTAEAKAVCVLMNTKNISMRRLAQVLRDQPKLDS